MSARRLEIVALASPVVLKSIVKLSLPESVEFSRDFMTQFLPILRYNNPRLSWSVDRRDSVEIGFEDSTCDVIKSNTIPQSHVLMERLLGIDAQKHLLKDKYVPTEV